MKQFKKSIILFISFGLMYMGLEILWRGYTHWSMGIAGGICGVIVGYFNEFCPNMSMRNQCFLGTGLILLIEYIAGYILNIKLGLNIWDYSDLPLNINGQICLPFAILWFLLTILITYIDDFIRYKLFGEEKPEPFITYIIDLFK